MSDPTKFSKPKVINANIHIESGNHTRCHVLCQFMELKPGRRGMRIKKEEEYYCSLFKEYLWSNDAAGVIRRYGGCIEVFNQ